MVLYSTAAPPSRSSAATRAGKVQAAVRSGNVEMLALLFGKPANLDLEGSEFGTGLQATALPGQMDMVSLLLEHTANVNAKGGCWGSGFNAARRSSASASMSALMRVKGEMLRVLEIHSAEGLPDVMHEMDDWKLSPAGWTRE